MPWVDGPVAADVGLTAHQWRAYGDLLAASTRPCCRPSWPTGCRGEDHRTLSVGTAHAVDASVSAAPAAAGSVDDEIATATRIAWSAASGAIREVVRMTDVLGGRLRPSPRDDVLCHGDAHVFNVVVGQSGQPWLLDWDDAVLAPRERDLMFVLGGVTSVSPTEQEWFFDGYGRVDGYGRASTRCAWRTTGAHGRCRTSPTSRPAPSTRAGLQTSAPTR